MCSPGLPPSSCEGSVRLPRPERRPPADRGGPAALAGHRGHVPATAPRLSAQPTLPARANAEATAPLITPPRRSPQPCHRTASRLLVPCLPGRVTLTGAGLIGVHERGTPRSTAHRHYARKHGQGGTDGFLRGHARHLAEELLLRPNAGFRSGISAPPGRLPLKGL